MYAGMLPSTHPCCLSLLCLEAARTRWNLHMFREWRLPNPFLVATFVSLVVGLCGECMHALNGEIGGSIQVRGRLHGKESY